MAEYKVSDIYQGGYSSLTPSYGNVFTGYRVPVSQLGMTTDPQSAAILNEVSSKTNLGAKQMEVETIMPKVFDAIPKQYFKELNQMSKLTGVDVSFHGPLVEPSGMTQQGFTEANREAAERQIQESMERIHDANPENMIVNFHTSNMFPAPEVSKTKEGEKIEATYVVNTEDGRLGKVSLKERQLKTPGEEINIETEIADRNEEFWTQNLSHLTYNTERATEFIQGSKYLKKTGEAEKAAGKELTQEEKQAKFAYTTGTSFLNDSYRQFKELYETAHRNSTPENRKELDKIGKQITEKIEKIKTADEEQQIKLKREIIEDGVEALEKLPAPEMFKPLDEFMMDKTTTSFGNAAFNTYKKFKEGKMKGNAPVMVIENPPANQQFSRGEDVKNIVEGARQKFEEAAIKDGMSKVEAKKKAEELIGASWDVGHINMLRQFGFEEKDIIKETEKVKPFVKHVHLSDNFGFEHTELPMGMGNVPFKKIMEKLGKQGYDAKKIIEAGDWWTQHMPKGAGAPFAPSLEGMGSPIYSMAMAPYWNQSIGLQQGYLGGYGEMLPQVNYETFGAGFSQLPSELGGQRAGAGGSRMSGKPME